MRKYKIKIDKEIFDIKVYFLYEKFCLQFVCLKVRKFKAYRGIFFVYKMSTFAIYKIYKRTIDIL